MTPYDSKHEHTFFHTGAIDVLPQQNPYKPADTSQLRSGGRLKVAVKTCHGLIDRLFNKSFSFKTIHKYVLTPENSNDV